MITLLSYLFVGLSFFFAMMSSYFYGKMKGLQLAKKILEESQKEIQEVLKNEHN